MIVWGGQASDQDARQDEWFTELQDGWRYDPVLDTQGAVASLQTGSHYFSEAGGFGEVFAGVADNAR